MEHQALDSRGRTDGDLRRLVDGGREQLGRTELHAAVAKWRHGLSRATEGPGRHDQLLGELVRALSPGDATSRSDAQALQFAWLHAARRECGSKHEGCRTLACGDAGLVPRAVR